MNLYTERIQNDPARPPMFFFFFLFDFSGFEYYCDDCQYIYWNKIVQQDYRNAFSLVVLEKMDVMITRSSNAVQQSKIPDKSKYLMCSKFLLAIHRVVYF